MRKNIFTYAKKLRKVAATCRTFPHLAIHCRGFEAFLFLVFAFAPLNETCAEPSLKSTSAQFSSKASVKHPIFQASASVKSKSYSFDEEEDFALLEPTVFLKLNLNNLKLTPKSSLTENEQYAESKHSPAVRLHFPIIIPVVAFAGNLSLSGCFKEINSPALPQSSSPFKHFSGTVKELSVSKAAPSTEPKPFAQFYQLDAGKLFSFKNAKLNFSFFSDIDENFAFSLNSSVPFKREKGTPPPLVKNISFSGSMYNFLVSHENSSWFSSKSFFPEERRLFLSSSFGLSMNNPFAAFLNKPTSSKFLEAKVHANLYQTSFSPEGTFKTEMTLFGKNKSLSAAFFTVFDLPLTVFDTPLPGDGAANSTTIDIFTPTGKELNTLFQFFLAPEMTFFSSDNGIKTRLGASFQFDEKTTEKLLRANIGFETKTKKFRIKMSTGIKDVNFIENEESSTDSGNESRSPMLDFEKAAIQGSSNFSLLFYPFVKANFSASSGIMESETQNRAPFKGSISVSAVPDFKKHLTLKAAISFKENEPYISYVSTGASWNYKVKCLSLSASATIKFSFQ